MNDAPGPVVLVAGGGTAGHVEPALALADAVVRRDPASRVLALGTASGLEARLVPARGYRLLEIDRVPLPRRPTPALLRVPGRLARAVRQAGRHLDEHHVDVVVGFGGYVALPAYLAARRRRTPIVVHEANARAGLANRVGARLTPHVVSTVAGTGLRGEQVLGLPLRREVAQLDRSAARPAARRALGLGEGPVLLVTGGSQGARRINEAVAAAAHDLVAAGAQVLHVTGPKNAEQVAAQVGQLPGYVVVPYVDGMQQAYAAADLVLCRSGAMTCAELAAVGLPAVYVPLPHGNGEQALNASALVAAGGGVLVDDGALDAEAVRSLVLPLLTDPDRLRVMGTAAAGLGHRDADLAVADLVLSVVRTPVEA